MKQGVAACMLREEKEEEDGKSEAAGEEEL